MWRWLRGQRHGHLWNRRLSVVHRYGCGLRKLALRS
jgi:hypothetical protein